MRNNSLSNSDDIIDSRDVVARIAELEDDRATISDELADAVKDRNEPCVAGSLVESGISRLRNTRYRKRLASVADIIAALTHFRLVGFEEGTPVYKACGGRGSFLFKNVAWQAGGDGPELVNE